MKTVYIILTLVLCISVPSKGQFYRQYFDGADTSASNSILIDIIQDSSNIWQIGKPQKAIFNTAATQPNAIVTDTLNFYPINDTSRFIAKVARRFGTSGIIAIQWRQKLDMDTAFDGGTIEYSIDSGNTWVSVFNNPYVYSFYGYDSSNVDTLIGGTTVFNGTDTTWRNIWLCFSNSWLVHFSNLDTLLLRFSIITDSINNHKEGWTIDNMLVYNTFIHTIKQTPQETYLKIYPNPTNNVIHIEIEKLSQYHIIEHMELIDAVGKVVAQWHNIPTKFWFETNQYPNGQYLLKVQTNIKTVTQRLTIGK